MPVRIPDEIYPAILKQLKIVPRGKEVSPAEICITYYAATDEVGLVDVQAQYTPRDLPYEQYLSAIFQLAHHLRQASPHPMSIGDTLQLIASEVLKRDEGPWKDATNDKTSAARLVALKIR